MLKIKIQQVSDKSKNDPALASYMLKNSDLSRSSMTATNIEY